MLRTVSCVGVQAQGFDAATTQWPTAASGVVAHTKGVWAEVVASTPWDACAVEMQIGDSDATNKIHLLDLGIGPPGDEHVLVTDLMLQLPGSGDDSNYPYFFVIPIPKGSRLAIRTQTSTTTSHDVRAVVTLYRAGRTFPQLGTGRISTYGASPSTTRGTSIDPGASANTKGGWVQVAASVDLIRAIQLAFGPAGNVARQTYSWTVDLGIGPSGDEQIVLADIPLASNSGQDEIVTSLYGPCEVFIPSGSRLAMRAACSGADASDRLFDTIAYGIG